MSKKRAPYERKPYTQKDFYWINWTPAQIKKRAKEIIAAEKQDHETIIDIPKKDRTFNNTIIGNFRKADIHDHHAMALLSMVAPQKAVRDACRNALLSIQEVNIELSEDKRIYEAIKEYNPHSEALERDAIKLYKDIIKSLKRRGFDLPQEQRKILLKNYKKMMLLSQNFEKNLNEFHDEMLVTREELDGLPDNYIKRLSKKGDNYVVTMSYPDIGPFKKLATNMKKQKELSDRYEKKGGKQNLNILKQLVTLRNENAKILGYPNHAEYVLDQSLAKSPEKVYDFLDNIYREVKDSAKKEDEDIQIFRDNFFGGRQKLQYFETSYISNLMNEELNNIDWEYIREFLPLEHVLKSMFDIFSRLFGVSFQSNNLKLWHSSVMYFDVTDQGSGEHRGSFALDLFPRKGKYSHACMMPVYNGSVDWGSPDNSNYIPPFAVMISNFTPPGKSQPSLISFDELTTLFHEMGHMMHELLTTSRFSSQSGAETYVDFVELPSQMMEIFCFDKKVLKKITKHHKTGKPLPHKLMDRIIENRYFRRASGIRNYIISDYLDMDMHTKRITIPYNDYARKLSKKYGKTTSNPHSLYPASLGHLAGGYDARLYSYLWTLVYAYDCFEEFKKKGGVSKEVGMRFRKEILERGSSREEMESLKAFLGRKPNNRAYIKSLRISNI